MNTVKCIEESLINEDTLKDFETFRNKQHTVESIYAELNILKQHQIVRIVGVSTNTCSECKKKAIFLVPSNNTYLCWFHGYNVAKNR